MASSSGQLTDHQFELLRRRVKGADDLLAALRKRHEQRNAALIASSADVVPGANAAVLEVTIRASGQVRRRLRRRLYHPWRMDKSGWVQYRAAQPFDWITYHTLEAELSALASGAELVNWRLVPEPIEWSEPALP
jgi:hypothetical protein